MRSVHGPVSRQRIQQHTALSAVLSNGPPPGDQRFPAFAPPFLTCVVTTLWGCTVRCAESWLFSTTGSSVSSED